VLVVEEEPPNKLDPAALVTLIPAGIDVTPFTLSTPDTIARELHLLQQRRDLISVYFNRSQIWFLSVLQIIDEKHQTFSFDISVDEAQNSAFERTSHAVFAAQPGGIKIQFEILSGIKRIVDLDGGPSFQAQFPLSLINLQRRNFLRVPLPIAKPLLCTLRHRNGAAINAQLYDLSIGGTGLVITNGVDVAIGDKFNACRIALSSFGIAEVNLIVMSKRQATKPDLSMQTVVGTNFVNLSRKSEALLHRYIGQLERERHRLERE
jgi:c-di-GMP-binding flagellar brake protein YcgR